MFYKNILKWYVIIPNPYFDDVKINSQVAYAIVWLKPSWHCGPFSGHDKMYKVFSEKVMELLPTNLHGALDYITSPGIVIPTLVLMILVIYNLISTSGLLKEANEDLKEQVCVNIIPFHRVLF